MIRRLAPLDRVLPTPTAKVFALILLVALFLA